MENIAGRVRLAAVAATAVLALGLSQNAKAGMSVIDIPGLVNAVQNFIATGVQYEKEVSQWKSLEKDAKIGGSIHFKMRVPSGLQFDPVDADYLVAETCGEEARVMTLVRNFVNFSSDASDHKEKQRQLCVNLQFVRNQKFNDTVEFIDTTIKDAEIFANAISQRRDASNSSGNVRSAQSDADRFNAQLAIKVQQWEASMKSYDAYIEVMQGYQNQLARAAFRGKNGGFLGDAAQTLALKRALDVE